MEEAVEPIASGVLAQTVTTDLLSGVLNEIISLLPICLPVMITFIGIRKGISFVSSILHSA